MNPFPGPVRTALVAGVSLMLLATNACAAGDAATVAWWQWPIALFVATFLLGIVAVLAGVGGGVLFVPIVGGLFPFHIDFVRGTGLLIALSGAISAAPQLLRAGMASLRLAMPFALVGSVTSIIGALVGLALPNQVVQVALGATILAIALLMLGGRRSEYPEASAGDRLCELLRLHGVFVDPATERAVPWRVRRTAGGLVAFAGIGMLAGMFGLGAGWANVPVLNLMLNVPLKMSVATSGLMLSIVDTSAAWVYIHRGAVLPILTVPSIVGVMLGARIGARLLRVTPAARVRMIVIVLLAAAGLRALLKGLGIWQ